MLEGGQAILARIDGLELGRLPVYDGSQRISEAWALTKSLESAEHELDRLRALDREQKRLGCLLGSILLGREHLESPSPLDRALGRRFPRDRSSERYVLFELTIQRPELSALPWEMAIWQLDHDEIHLGVDERVGFVRKTRFRGYAPAHWRHDFQPPWQITHVTALASPGEGLFATDHEEIQKRLTALCHRHPLLGDPLVETAIDWLRRLSAHPADRPQIDILQYLGHGDRGQISWSVYERHRPTPPIRMVGLERFLRTVGGISMPAMFILLACNSIDPEDDSTPGFAEQLIWRGAAAVLGIRGAHDIRLSDVVSAFFLGTLMHHGRPELAVQSLRRWLKYGLEGGGYRGMQLAPGHWSRPVLLCRHTEALDLFEAMRFGPQTANPLSDVDRRALKNLVEALHCRPDELLDNACLVLQLLDDLDSFAVDWGANAVRIENAVESLRSISNSHVLQSDTPEAHETVKALSRRRDELLWEMLSRAAQSGLEPNSLPRVEASGSASRLGEQPPSGISGVSSMATSYRGYYATALNGSIQLYGTYNEKQAIEAPSHPELGLYTPYGTRTWRLESSDIVGHPRDVTFGRGNEAIALREVRISEDFLYRNGLTLPVADPKYPPKAAASWAPYGSADNYWAAVQKRPRDSAVRKAVSALHKATQGLDRMRDVCNLLKTGGHLAALASLIEIVCTPTRSEESLVRAISDALPPELPAPIRRHRPERRDGLKDRDLWMTRLLYALATGLQSRAITP